MAIIPQQPTDGSRPSEPTPPRSPSSEFLGGRLLAGNAIWNLIGLAAPLLAAIVAVPDLVAVMGTDRFGLLGIIWVVIGYFSLFDMGLGRALTKLMAERIDRPRDIETTQLVWTALAALAVLGILTAVLVFSVAQPLVVRVLKVPQTLMFEGIASIRILAIGIPFVVISSALIGLLEAYQKFRLIALVRVPLGIWTFVGPMITVQFSSSLVFATAVLVLGRMAFTLGYFLLARRVVVTLRTPTTPRSKWFRPLFSFGGWLSVSNIVGPIMVYCDRIFIAAMITTAAVAYYITPYEMVTRLAVLPQAVMGVLFPAIALAVYADSSRLAYIVKGAAGVIGFGMVPIASAILLFAPEALEMWLGIEFSVLGTPIARLLAFGLLVNSVARVPVVLLQASGRPDKVAKLHLTELVPYLALLWFLIDRFGINGAAMAWLIRVVVDTIGLILMGWTYFPLLRRMFAACFALLLGAGLLFAALTLVAEPATKLAILFAISAASVAMLAMHLNRLKGTGPNGQ